MNGNENRRIYCDTGGKGDNSLGFDKLINSMTQGFAFHEIVCDASGRPDDYLFIYVNPAFESLTGLKIEKIRGKTVKTVFPDIEDFWIETYGETALSGKAKTFEHYTESVSKWFEVTAYSPRQGYFACVFSDITERKKSEEELRLFKTIIESSGEAIAVSTPDGKFTYINSAHEKLFGIPRHKALNMNFVNYYPAHSEEYLKEFVVPELMNGRSWEGELDVLDSSGRIFRLWERADSIKDEKNGIKYFFGLMHDVTESKKMKADMELAEKRLQSFVSSVDDAIYFIALDGKIICFNPACYRHSGYSEEEFRADPDLWQKIIDRNDLSGFLSFLETKPKNFTFREIEFRLRNKNGSLRWINTKITPAFSSRGKLEGYNCIGRDVTKNKRSEKILTTSSRIASFFLTSSPENIFRDILNFLLEAFNAKAGFIVYFENRDTPKFLSTFPDNLLQECMLDPDIWSNFNICSRAINEKKIIYKNSEINYPPGHIPIENAISAPIILRDSIIAQVVLADRLSGFDEEDCSVLNSVGIQIAPVIESHIKTVQKERERRYYEEEKKKLEQQYRQAQKIEAIGQLAGGMAHDLNNMLSPILGYSELLLDDFRDSTEICNCVTEIKKAAERARDLVKHLLAFSRKQILELMTEDLNYIIARMERMLRLVIMENIRLDMIPAGYPINIKVDRLQIEQIILNLVLNAQDAMPQGGTLSICTSLVFLDSKFLNAENSRMRPGNYGLLEIRDTGHGMSPEIASHIFEPFYTTKEVGKGTGLGLASVHGIVSQHDGLITVKSETGRGSIFRIYFPAFDSCDTPGKKDDMDEPVAFGSEVIFLVEDNEMVRFFVEHILRRHGFSVIVADRPEKGLEILKNYPAQIHLLLTDVIMPEMNGKEFHEKAALIKPGLKVLYMSGYSADILEGQGMSEKGIRLIKKPFSIAELINAVRNGLDE